MVHSLRQKLFFLNNDREVNRLVFRIGWIFMAVLVGLFFAAYFNIFRVKPASVLYIMLLLTVTEGVFYLLLRLKVPEGVIKYYGLVAMEFCVALMAANAYFGIYISYILVPVISCLYFDRKLTRNITIICYFGMMIALWFRAPGAVKLNYPDYTPLKWFVAFGLGYTLEYAALFAVLTAVSSRSRRHLEALYSRNERISEIQNKIIYRFADLVESRDDSTGKHVKRTSRYVVLIARQLRQGGHYARELSDEDISNLEMASPLHDIGKIVIPDAILKKPGKLTPEEFAIIKTHAVEGGKIVESALAGIEKEEFLSLARDIALCHHERWDGTGYPQGLAGTDIPLAARIMAVADVFDALVSDRCYKNAVSVEDALIVIRDGRGTHFDPVVADAFLMVGNQISEVMKEE